MGDHKGGRADGHATKAVRGALAAPVALQRFQVSVIEGPGRGATREASSGRLSIGSHEGNDLTLDDPTVSRFHCELRVEPRGLRVTDLDSRNGTVVDSARMLDGFLRDGSVLVLGSSWVRVDFGTETYELPVSEDTRFGSLVGQSVAMRAAFAAMEAAAGTDATVLLEGETGTGKEEAAASIHAASPRADGPFVVVDCGAMPSEMLLSELFGHEKGAFTGADARRIGAFEEASGGTIFLDEIGELPLDLQPKLLRVLERREIRRLGQNKYSPVDVRVIAATNRDLRKAANEDTFRSDLYFRLAVITVRMPALRERPQDLPMISEIILRNLGAGEDTIEALLTADFHATLARGSWTGNVRELRNYLERCLVFKKAMPVTRTDGAGSSTSPAHAAIDPTMPYQLARRRAVEAFERDYVAALLDLHDGKMTRAAEAAGLGRVHLWRLAKKHR
jgi:DNA-binding NtrC family response regulator